MSASPCSETQHRAGGGATTEKDHRQASNCRGPAAESPQHEPALEAKRILMVDFTSTQAWAKGVAPSANREESETKTATAESMDGSSPPTADVVHRLYCQLVEIHAITTVQLAECVCLR
jgi:hypothetical protein